MRLRERVKGLDTKKIEEQAKNVWIKEKLLIRWNTCEEFFIAHIWFAIRCSFRQQLSSLYSRTRTNPLRFELFYKSIGQFMGRLKWPNQTRWQLFTDFLFISLSLLLVPSYATSVPRQHYFHGTGCEQSFYPRPAWSPMRENKKKKGKSGEKK